MEKKNYILEQKTLLIPNEHSKGFCVWIKLHLCSIALCLCLSKQIQECCYGIRITGVFVSCFVTPL